MMVIFSGPAFGKVRESPFSHINSIIHPFPTPALGNSKGEHDMMPPRALHLTYICKSTADIVKMIDSQPDLAPVIRRVRGGYLKIQGTWMPYEVSLTRFLLTAVLTLY